MRSEFAISSEFATRSDSLLKCSESLHFVLIYYTWSSESLRIANSLQEYYNTTESGSVLKTVREGPLGSGEYALAGLPAFRQRSPMFANLRQTSHMKTHTFFCNLPEN